MQCTAGSVLELLIAEQFPHKERLVGGDCVDAELYHLCNLLFAVDGPDVGRNLELVGAFDYRAVFEHHLLVVVEAVDPVGSKLLGSVVLVEILVHEGGILPCYAVAHVFAETYEHQPGGIQEIVRLECLYALVYQGVLAFGSYFFLEFEHEDCGNAFFALGEVFVESGDFLAVGKKMLRKAGGLAGVDAGSVDKIVVEHKHYVVGGNMDVEFAAPESMCLGFFKGSDRVLGKAGGLAVPEAPVGYYGGLSALIYLWKSCLSAAGCHGQQRRCGNDGYVFKCHSYKNTIFSVHLFGLNDTIIMIKINLAGCGSFVKDSDYKNYLSKALDAFDVLDAESGAGNDFLGWKTLPVDTPESLIADCEAVRDDWKAQGVDLAVVIGIGGSYLGARCAIEALSHQFVPRKDAIRVVFAGNNLSEDYLAELMDLVYQCNAACVVISKSGTTTEPAVAFRVVKDYLEQRYGKKGAASRIVAITDAHKGALKTLSTQEGYRTFVVPDNVGGRFSVLTPVGLLPIVLAGFDVRAMLKGAADERAELIVKGENNAAVQYAAMRNLIYSVLGKKVEVLVSYNPKFQYLGEWWKQLYGESEGKDGKGIFPASVNFTTDLHSMGQFIQDGDRTVFETVVAVEKAHRSVVIGSDEQNLDQLNYLAGQHVEHCNAMAALGTKLAHIDGGVPQIDLSVESIDEYNLGALFYFFEFACGISAYILGVNPFNQPGVEAYKKNMFALLRKPGFEAQTEEILKRI